MDEKNFERKNEGGNLSNHAEHLLSEWNELKEREGAATRVPRSWEKGEAEEVKETPEQLKQREEEILKYFMDLSDDEKHKVVQELEKAGGNKRNSSELLLAGILANEFVNEQARELKEKAA